MRDFMEERRRQRSQEISSQADELIARIAPILKEENVQVQGAVVAELMAIHLGGYRPKLRAPMLQILVDTAIAMIPLHDGWNE